MEGVVNVTDAIDDAGLHGSTVRTATAYCVPDFRGPMVTEARVPALPGWTCGATAADPNWSSVIVGPVW
jgi:hypothetical protein